MYDHCIFLLKDGQKIGSKDSPVDFLSGISPAVDFPSGISLRIFLLMAVSVHTIFSLFYYIVLLHYTILPRRGWDSVCVGGETKLSRSKFTKQIYEANLRSNFDSKFKD